jgi:hypothetical protein
MDTKLRSGNSYLDDTEYAVRQMVARPQRELPYEELLKPGAWSHHTQHQTINPGTLIHVLPEDGSYYALLIVQSKNPLGMAVAEVLKKDLNEASALMSVSAEAVYVEWGGAHKWRIVRAADNDILAKEFTNEQDALGWAASNRKKIVSKPSKAA